MSDTVSKPLLRNTSPTRRLLLLALALGASVAALVSSRLSDRVHVEASARPEVMSAYLDRREGKLYRIGSSHRFSGWMIDRHPTGALKSRTEIVDGLKNGLSEEWGTNGVLQVRQSFRHDLPDGLRTTWYPDGHKMSEGMLVASLQQGEYRRWHENGTLAVKAQFKDGKPDGPSIAWHESGFLQAEAVMKQGAVVERHFYTDRQQRTPTLLSQATIP